MEQDKNDSMRLALEINSEDSNNKAAVFSWKNAKALLQASLSTVGSELIWCFNDFIFYYYVGHMHSSTYMAGFGIGNTFMNSICFSLYAALDVGYLTLGAQAFGDKDSEKASEFFSKTVISYVFVGIPICLILAFSNLILPLLGISDAVVNAAAEFIWFSLPSAIFQVIYAIYRISLQAQKIFYVGTIILAINALLTWGTCTFFFAQGWELFGLAMARNIAHGISLLIILSYVYFSKKNPKFFFPTSRQELIEVFKYLKTSCLLGGPKYLQTISWQIHIFIISLLDQTEVTAAHSSFTNGAYWFYTVPSGLATANNVYVGNEVGANNPKKAKSYVTTTLTLNTFLVAILTAVMYFGRFQLAEIYTDEEEVRPIIANMMVLYTIAFVGDSYRAVLERVMRTVGRERLVLLAAVLGIYVIGLPFEYVAGVKIYQDYTYIFIGMIIGFYLITIILTVSYARFDWEKEIPKVRAEHGIGRHVKNLNGRYH